MGRLSKGGGEGGGRDGGGFFGRFRSHIIFKYTPAVRSKIFGACYTRGARSRRSCGWLEKRGR